MSINGELINQREKKNIFTAKTNTKSIRKFKKKKCLLNMK